MILICILDFGELCTLVRNDILGLSDKRLPIKKIAKSLGLEDPDIAAEALEALAYMMLHLAKIKAS